MIAQTEEVYQWWLKAKAKAPKWTAWMDQSKVRTRQISIDRIINLNGGTEFKRSTWPYHAINACNLAKLHARNYRNGYDKENPYQWMKRIGDSKDAQHKKRAAYYKRWAKRLEFIYRLEGQA